MSQIVVPDQGEEAFLDLVLAVNYTLRLFTNDVTAGLTPDEVDQLDESDFTEATFAGYAASAITGGTWTTTEGNPSTGVNTQRTFTRSSTGTAQLVRGYYLTTTTGGFLRWFEEFDAPISVEFLNDAIQVTPRITLDDTGGNVSVPIGSSVLWSGPASQVPSGFLLRDGSAVSRTTYALLFATIGTAYGVGDGSTTFNLPDQRGRFPLGVAASGTGAVRGTTGGAIDHVHGLDTTSSGARVLISTAAPELRLQRKSVASYNTTHGAAVTDTTNTDATTTGTALTGDSDTENPPFLADYFIIRAL